jgi:hypothetical protein
MPQAISSIVISAPLVLLGSMVVGCLALLIDWSSLLKRKRS